MRPLNALVKLFMRNNQSIFISTGLIIAVLNIFPFSAYSQVASEGASDTRAPSDKPFRWGLKIGTTLNQFNQSGMTVGFNGGGFAKYTISPLLDVQGELLYMMQGSGRDDYTRNFSDSGGFISSVRYLNRAVSMMSAEIPIMAIFKLGSIEGAVQPKVMVGGSFGYCFAVFERHDKIYTMSDGTEGIAGYEIENVGADYEPMQFDAILGFGIDYNLSNGKMVIMDVRYNYGLNDLNLFKSPYLGGAIYQNTVSINCSYAF